MNDETNITMCADFETVVTGDAKQDCTEVWSAAWCNLNADDIPESVTVVGAIDKFLHAMFELLKITNVICYFHNLKFDGSFILDWLLRSDLWHLDALENHGIQELTKNRPYKMSSYTYTYSISKMGQWYTITLKTHGHYLEFRDSLKLLPFTLGAIGKAFDTKHKKLKMKYEGARYANCPISDDEMDYIKNDVLVLKEALNIMFSEGHNKLTIGACCKAEYRGLFCGRYKEMWDEYYPDLTKIELDNALYGASDADEYIRKSYHGGWCYLKPEKANIEFSNYTHVDVNSLYPSVMSGASGNKFPTHCPHFFKGDIPENVKRMRDKFYLFVRFSCHFMLKDGFLPTVQIKGSPLFYGREWLTSSIVKDKFGNDYDVLVTLTMTETDFDLFKTHYNVTDLTILDGCYFWAEIGIFDKYITKWADKKINAKNKVERTIAKLFMNSLYGKTATSPDSTYKVGYLDNNDALRFYEVEEAEKRTWYVACGSAIASYARNFTITAAQKNYKHFIYSDTDSLILDISPDEVVGCPEHETAFLHWKYETQGDYVWCVRSKTYIEHVTHENRKEVKPYYNVKCAGMPARSRDLFIASVTQDPGLIARLDDDKHLSDNEKKTIDRHYNWSDFKVGLKVGGCLKAHRVKGGTVLYESDFVMREDASF